MYIKQIIIQGFKSYRDQTVIEPFDHRHNVVVGRNGSGKSNFFYAIQFVLSDEFSHLRPDQRQALLHEGTGPRVISAYVEIIFDNSDGRLPIDKEEVYLRRVIGSKKDQYFLNKKVVPKTDVMNLLESAGFSRSNPYYIVKQGKINQMATAPDSQRLKLLREVAGTRVYDERREESKVLLKECESKREKIEEFLRTIEDRLSALEEEKEELKEYQKWDKMRRSLEYTIHDRELKDNRKKLDDMENQRNNSGKEQEKLKNQLQNAQEKAKTAAKELKDVKSKVGAAKEERDAYNAENQQLLKDRTRLELTIRDLSDEVMGDNKSKERAEQELEKLRQTISQKEGELEKNRPQYEEMKRKEEECTRELSLKEQKRKELYAKQGRGSQFTSKDQRDQWIQKELRSLNKQIKDKKEQIDRLSEDLTKDAEKKVQLERRIEEMTGEMDRYRLSIDDHNKGFYDMKKRKDQLQSERNELWRKENNLQQTLASLKEELSRADQSLRSMAGKPILNGRDSVRKVLDTFRERGGQWAEYATMYYGPVIELFDCEKTIYTAVEVTAGNRLFHHVVDSDKVGTQILKEMNKQKLPGEVTFMPLNRLAVRDIEYPQTNDAIPMVSKMNYDDRYDKALKYIFGRTLICRNLEVATQLAKTNRLDCVTMDGDQVMSKGSLTGGYFNTSRSRLEIQKTRSEFMQQIAESEDEFSTLKDQLRSTEAEINKIVSEMQRTETKNSKAKDVFDKVKADIRLMKEELNGIERSRQPKERSLNTLRANLEAMMNTKDGLESELHQDLMTTLSVEDQHEVDKLNDDIRRLTRENKEAFSMRMKLEAEKNKLENLLTNNLNRRKDELMQALQEISVEDRKRQLEHSKAELARSEEKIADVSKNLKDFEKKVSALQKKQKEAQKEVETWKTKEKEVQERIDEDAKDLEKMASRQNVLQNKIAECTKKIRELGSLPSDAFDKYQALSTKQLFKKLEQSNGELKKYSHVNKKALDQFVHFSEHKEKLMQRKDQQNRGYEKIMELMSVLEQRKFEAIQFTFKQVSKNFTEVFGKLVPQGHAQLIMKTDQDDDDDDEPARPTTVDSFTGVGIRVSFSGKRAEMREMNQLSGGQKSLVALALIFAIQKCDPAPFYLFDEIDQALDATHRKAVADMIHELAGEAQFITTTFRPELLEHANKFYGVKFRNKVSHVVCVTREEAYDFVEDDATHS
ncbi:Structural maintenance of chromosomes protein 3 [Amphibalanus amphitrite]|uniref:Structural maintenance of chromosomes protein n=2 Tax=Amphibalanus amphitrite TaxID=1232801 RepID=A0A6A4XA32_AMPAM|nr:structural maintenance of chromosomes protein 3-like isoform X1 [Amphibalanus amphitrite]XP_043224377.1 structural maintenance of chromosomes protein 3-like isoform X1 [Amphibalanus amphitrite]KAF0312854.1 Structural maintenance of chromosomes protein 3 [Amphibalanus amphitrite]